MYFVYYRVLAQDLALTLAVVRAAHIDWQQQAPASQVTLMQRSPGPTTQPAQGAAELAAQAPSELTLMEVFSGVDGALQSAWQRWDANLTQALGPMLKSPRHLEVFAPCASQ